MKNIVVAVLIALVTISLQTGSLGPFAFKGFFINIPLAFVIYINWLKSSSTTLFLTILYAWGVSYTSIMPFGFELIALTLVAGLTQYISFNYLTNKQAGGLIIMLVFGLAVYYGVLWSLMHTPFIIHAPSLKTVFYVHRFFIQFILTVALFFFIHMVYRRYETKKTWIVF